MIYQFSMADYKFDGIKVGAKNLDYYCKNKAETKRHVLPYKIVKGIF